MKTPLRSLVKVEKNLCCKLTCIFRSPGLGSQYIYVKRKVPTIYYMNEEGRNDTVGMRTGFNLDCEKSEEELKLKKTKINSKRFA
jgi:hypothetical protein